MSFATFHTGDTLVGQAPAAINSVAPQRPSCILLEHTATLLRTLTIEGTGIYRKPDAMLQLRRFVPPDEHELSILFANEVEWLSPTRATLDMARIERFLWPGPKMNMQVRIADAHGKAISEWSDLFYVARNPKECGKDRFDGIITPLFPPTSPERGVSGDLWADVVIGQPDFTQVGPDRVVPFKLFNPGGVVVDRSAESEKAYIWDSANSRVLGVDLAECYAGESPCWASIVIGQPSPYDHGACNRDSGMPAYPVRAPAGPDTLCGIFDHTLTPWESTTFVTMDIDSTNALYVPDSMNHRILKYENPFVTDQVADEVWGQPDFNEMLCNGGTQFAPTPKTLCFHSNSNRFVTNFYGSGVEIDQSGNMWVADSGNNRVVRFPWNPATDGIEKEADLVLGQPDLYSAQPGSGLGEFHAPSAVGVNRDGWVYVADAANDRVLVFQPPFKSGMTASFEFASQFYGPTSVEVDPVGEGVWVHDSRNHMVALWSNDGTELLKVLSGKRSYEPNDHCPDPIHELPDNPHMCRIGGGLGIDRQGNVLVPVYLDTADVFRIPTRQPGSDTPAFHRPDRRLFHPPSGTNLKVPEELRSARGVAVWEDQLIVADIHRLVYWNGLDGLSNGQPPDGVVGGDAGWPRCCGRIKTDAAGRLWTLGFQGADFMDVYQLPLTSDSVPIHTLWTNETAFPVLGTEDEVTIGNAVHGIAPVGRGEFLWLSDTDNHRVVRIRDPLVDPVVDVILGQEDANDKQCNRGLFPAPIPWSVEDGSDLDVLCYPAALAIDRLGNLYVSDHALEVNGNRRLLMFSETSLTPVENKTIFAPRATKAFRRSAERRTNKWSSQHDDRAVIGGSHGPLSAATWEPAFDSRNRMAVGYNAYVAPRFVGVYDNPQGPETLPNGFMYDFVSMAYSVTFDDDDNLYVGDINRARVLVYRNPFGSRVQYSPEPFDSPPPTPQYPLNVEAVFPEPPECVVRRSGSEDQSVLKLVLDSALTSRDQSLQFRRVTDIRRRTLSLKDPSVRSRSNSISIDMVRFGPRLIWDMSKAKITVRILDSDGIPRSNWSPAFIVADDPETCGYGSG